MINNYHHNWENECIFYGKTKKERKREKKIKKGKGKDSPHRRVSFDAWSGSGPERKCPLKLLNKSFTFLKH